MKSEKQKKKVIKAQFLLQKETLKIHGEVGHICTKNCPYYLSKSGVPEVKLTTCGGCNENRVVGVTVLQKQLEGQSDNKVMVNQPTTGTETNIPNSSADIFLVHGIPECNLCNGTGLHYRGFPGKLKGCRKCSKELNICKTCNFHGYTIGSNGEKKLCKQKCLQKRISLKPTNDNNAQIMNVNNNITPT